MMSIDKDDLDSGQVVEVCPPGDSCGVSVDVSLVLWRRSPGGVSRSVSLCSAFVASSSSWDVSMIIFCSAVATFEVTSDCPASIHILGVSTAHACIRLWNMLIMFPTMILRSL